VNGGSARRLLAARRLVGSYAIAKDVGGCSFDTGLCNWSLGASKGCTQASTCSSQMAPNGNIWTRGTETKTSATGPNTPGNNFLYYESSDFSGADGDDFYADFSSPPLTITSTACKVRRSWLCA
jgi:hypothetical protein